MCDGVIVFQQARNGYAGTVDTHIHEALPNTSFGNTLSILWDSQDLGDNAVIALIRFDDLFGASAIPNGATIQTATLALSLHNVSLPGEPATIHQASAAWAASVTWNTLGATPGAQDPEDMGPSLTNVVSCMSLPCVVNVDVQSSVAAWAAGTTNNGWIIMPGSTDGADAHSANASMANADERPTLTVEYSVAP